MGFIDSISSKKKSVFNGAVFSIFVRLTNVFVAFLLSILVARLIGKESFGIFVFLTSMSLFIAILSSFGLGKIALRMFAEKQYQASLRIRNLLFRRFFILWFIIGVVVFTGSLLVFLEYSKDLPFSIEINVAVLSICYGILVGWRVVIVEIYVANKFPFDAAVFDGFLSNTILLFLLFIVYITNSFEVNLLAVVALYSLAVLLIQLVSLVRVKYIFSSMGDDRNPLTDSCASMIAIFSKARFTFMHMLGAAFATFSDVWILGIFGTLFFLADYGVALKFATFISFLLGSFNSVLAPYFSHYIVLHERRSLESFCRFFATVIAIPSLMLASVLFVYGGDIISYVFGQSFKSAGEVLKVVVILHVVNVLSGSCGNMLVLYGRNKELMMVTLVTVGLTVVVAFAAGVEGQGSMAIVWCFVVGSAVRQFILWRLVKQLCGVNTAPTFDVPRLRGELVRLLSK